MTLGDELKLGTDPPAALSIYDPSGD